MAEYRLYCFAQSGDAYEAALMLSLCGVAWEPRFVDFFGGRRARPPIARSTRWARHPYSGTAGAGSRARA
jgi:glutathione S-transferase